MRAAWSSFGTLCLGTCALCLGCGAAGGGDKPANTAGSSASSGGAGASSGGSASGMPSGGQSQGGSAAGGQSAAGTASGGSGGAVPGASGTASGGASGGSSTASGFTCPAGPFDAPTLGAAAVPKRVEGVPPPDAFNNDNNDFTNIEGDVWIGDALYVSEINPKGPRPPSRILKITADDKVTILMPDSGTNGLATNDAGELFATLHKDGSVAKLSLTGGAATPLATMFMGMPFDSPNDLAVHKNGTVYFTDPSWQSPMPPPQSATRAYRIPPGGMPVAIEDLNQPNGITLSKNQDFLYIGGNQLKKYPVMADGSLGTGTTFVQGGSTDGMAIDCADNLYTASGSVNVYSSAGTLLGKIDVPGLSQITNVAFGGADHKTLYVSGQGAGAAQKGLFKVPMNLPGFPY